MQTTRFLTRRYVRPRLNVLLQLNYVSACLFMIGSEALQEAHFGRGSGPIHLDEVTCSGTEQRLVDCPANPVGDHNCFHREDAGVHCQPGE